MENLRIRLIVRHNCINLLKIGGQNKVYKKIVRIIHKKN